MVTARSSGANYRCHPTIVDSQAEFGSLLASGDHAAERFDGTFESESSGAESSGATRCHPTVVDNFGDFSSLLVSGNHSGEI